jgi:hypothetical protein
MFLDPSYSSLKSLMLVSLSPFTHRGVFNDFHILDPFVQITVEALFVSFMRVLSPEGFFFTYTS